MDRVNRAACAPPSYDPTQKLPKGPSLIVDPGERACVAAWLGHGEAGRIGSPSRPAAALRDAGIDRPEDIRAVTLAHARLMCGEGRFGVW